MKNSIRSPITTITGVPILYHKQPLLTMHIINKKKQKPISINQKKEAKTEIKLFKFCKRKRNSTKYSTEKAITN